MKKHLRIFSVLLLMAAISVNALAQVPVLVPNPAQTSVTLAGSDSVQFVSGGLTTTYTNSNWPVSANDTSCLYWGVFDTLYHVINGYNTTPTCSGMSNLMLDLANSDLAGGMAVFTGQTVYNFTDGYTWYPTILTVRMTLAISQVSDGHSLPFYQVGNYVLARIPDADFKVVATLMTYWPYGTSYMGPGTGWYNAVYLFNYLHTNPSSTICTSWNNGNFYKISFNPGFTTVNPSCYQSTNGTITLNVTGGVAPFTYSWNTSDPTSANQTGLGAGSYTLNITDSTRCMLTRTVQLTQPDSLRAALTVQNIDCAGNANGVVTSTPAGGTAPYQVAWQGGGDQNTLSGLAPGTYVITLTDSKSCTVKDSITVTEPPAIVYTVDSVQPTCSYSSDGRLAVNVSGGVQPYTYAWSTTDTVNAIENLKPGLYTFEVKDKNGCVKNMQTSLVSVSHLSLSSQVSDATCNGSKTGSVSLNVTGGAEPYAFVWSNGELTNPADTLPAGTYSVVITDNLNCTLADTFTVNQPAADVASFTYNMAAGSVSFTNTSTSGTYSWNFGDGNSSTDPNPSHTYQSSQTYHVCLTVTTSCGSTQSCQDVVVTGATGINTQAVKGLSLYPNPASDAFTLQWEGTETPAQVILVNMLGQQVMKQVVAGNALEVNVSQFTSGAYTLLVVYKDHIVPVSLMITHK